MSGPDDAVADVAVRGPARSTHTEQRAEGGVGGGSAGRFGVGVVRRAVVGRTNQPGLLPASACSTVRFRCARRAGWPDDLSGSVGLGGAMGWLGGCAGWAN